MPDEIEIQLEGGKYTYKYFRGIQIVLRNGEAWRDLVGDKFIFAMACRIVELEKNNKELQEQLENMETHLI